MQQLVYGSHGRFQGSSLVAVSLECVSIRYRTAFTLPDIEWTRCEAF